MKFGTIWNKKSDPGQTLFLEKSGTLGGNPGRMVSLLLNPKKKGSVEENGND